MSIALEQLGEIIGREQLAETEERLHLALEAAGMWAWIFEPERHVIALPTRMRHSSGHPDRLVTVEAVLARIHPDDRATVAERLTGAARCGEHFEVEYRVPRSDGAIVWILSKGSWLSSRPGAPMRMFGINQDITARKRAEEQLLLLAREVDHRAKNALALVQGIVRLTHADSMEAYSAAVEARVGALALAHAMLAERDWQDLPLRELLTKVIGHAAIDRIGLIGPDVLLPSRLVQPLALVFQEYLMNARRHGALSDPDGTLEIDWQVNRASGTFLLRWSEEGSPKPNPVHRGFGSRIVRLIIERQLGGIVMQEWRPSGLYAELTVPT